MENHSNHTRVALWDNLKFFLITAVVIGHFTYHSDYSIFKSIHLFVYAFHMPLFLFVAGLFHKNKNIVPKVVLYLSLYVISKVMIFLVKSFYGKQPSFSLSTTNNLPWFMFAMAVFVVLTYVLRDVHKGFLLVMAVLTACFAGYDDSVNSFLMLSRVIVYYPFYLAGSLIPREKFEECLCDKRLTFAAVAALLLWGTACFFFRRYTNWLLPFFAGRKPFREMSYPVCGALCRLLTYALSALTGLACIILTPRKQIRHLTDIGQKTLQIYLWHRIILYILTYQNVRLFLCRTYPGRALWLLLGILLVFLTSHKVFSFPTQLVLQYSKDFKAS